MKTIRWAWVCLLLGGLAACGGDDEAPGGGGDAGVDAAMPGDPDAGSSEDAGMALADAGEVDPDAGPDDPDAGPTTPGMVAWSEELDNPYELMLDSEVGLDYFLQYSVTVPDPNTPPTILRVRICQQPAGEASPSCVDDDRPATDGTFGIRYGIDPSSYREGVNLYTFTLQLRQDEAVVAEAVLEWIVTYTPM